tara:strand:+ start:1417 stop:2322 length:906 start_codon:yes stop_codon:yes gene_type:complete
MAVYKFKKKDQITNEIILLLDEGKNLSEIAKNLNLEEDWIEEALEAREIKKQRLSSGRYRKMVELRNEGFTLDEIGKKFDRTRERIRQIINKVAAFGPYEDLEVLSLEEIRERKRLQKEKEKEQRLNNFLEKYQDQVIKFYKEGNNNEQMLDLMQLTKDSNRDLSNAIKYLTQNLKISPVRPSRNVSKTSDRQKEIIYERISAMRQEGKSQQEIADTLGYSYPWVSNMIREMRDAGIYIANNHRMAEREYARDEETLIFRTKQITKLIQEGKKPSEIDKELGWKYGKAARHIRVHMNHLYE